MIHLKLVPVHGSQEVLVKGVAQRPTLEYRGSTLHIGRNTTTMVGQADVSRHLATIDVNSEGQVIMKILKHPHCMRLGGKALRTSSVVLQNQDRFSLFHDKYEYMVVILQQIIPQQENPCKHLTEETMCAICMDIMVDTHAVIPCGHVFCQSCLQSVSSCPTCRNNIHQSVSLKTMDNMIWHMIQNKMYEPDDVVSYLKRTGKQLHNEQRQDSTSPKKRKRAEPDTASPKVLSVSPRTTTPGNGYSVADAICID